tara:strand:- start:389 stop:1036 length:648 start_codon:yes stop_codon:yes gene_type:complete
MFNNLLLFLLVLTQSLNAQPNSGNSTIDISTGVFIATQETKIINYEYVIPEHFFLNSSGSFYAISYSPNYSIKKPGSSNYVSFDSEVSFVLVHPFSFSDVDISYSFSGFSFGLCPIGIDLLSKKENNDILILGGLNIGVNSIRIDDNRYSNFDLSPKLNIRYRGIYKKFVFGIGTHFQIDVSHPNWKEEKQDDVIVSSSRNHGYSFSLSLGYKFL